MVPRWRPLQICIFEKHECKSGVNLCIKISPTNTDCRCDFIPQILAFAVSSAACISDYNVGFLVCGIYSRIYKRLEHLGLSSVFMRQDQNCRDIYSQVFSAGLQCIAHMDARIPSQLLYKYVQSLQNWSSPRIPVIQKCGHSLALFPLFRFQRSPSLSSSCRSRFKFWQCICSFASLNFCLLHTFQLLRNL